MPEPKPKRKSKPRPRLEKVFWKIIGFVILCRDTVQCVSAGILLWLVCCTVVAKCRRLRYGMTQHRHSVHHAITLMCTRLTPARHNLRLFVGTVAFVER